MIVVVAMDHRFDRTPDGAVWTPTTFAYSFWTRYLDAFDGVRVAARVRDVLSPGPQRLRADGPQVQFAAVPHYHGPWQYVRRRRAVCAAVRDAVRPEDAVVLRAASQVANCAAAAIYADGRPFAVEVVGDPWDAFARAAVRHPLRAFFRRHFARQLRLQCLRARAAAYVTARTLPQRYPAAPGAYTTSYSSVELGCEALLDRPPALPRSARECRRARLVFTGTLAHLYKAPDVLLKAAAQCVRQGIDLELVLLGDGRYRPALERQAARLGLAERVFFRGQLPAGDAVREELDRADLFVLPSRTEGLPRAMIEAMARALPCIGSTVGGIPELLPPEDLVPPGDVAALARKIREVGGDPQRRQRMAARNLRRAADFREDVLRQRRNDFYRFLRQRTEQWIEQQRP